jgi:predicted RNA-binding Zn-ribbon protein involved in translation (DUF1610 family)
MKMHESVTLDRIVEAAKQSMFGGASYDDTGICVACGEDAYGVEPDAEKYECEACGEQAVYGGEQLLLLNVA